MAENEYLDASKGLRWRPVADAICEGLGVEEATGRSLDSLLKTLRHAGKEIPLADMLRAIDSPSELERLFPQVQGAEDIKYCLVRASREDSSPQACVEVFLGLSLRSALGKTQKQLQYCAAYWPSPPAPLPKGEGSYYCVIP